jgi:hypothetical protein
VLRMPDALHDLCCCSCACTLRPRPTQPLSARDPPGWPASLSCCQPRIDASIIHRHPGNPHYGSPSSAAGERYPTLPGVGSAAPPRRAPAPPGRNVVRRVIMRPYRAAQPVARAWAMPQLLGCGAVSEADLLIGAASQLASGSCSTQRHRPLSASTSARAHARLPTA